MIITQREYDLERLYAEEEWFQIKAEFEREYFKDREVMNAEKAEVSGRNPDVQSAGRGIQAV